jgi:hypothetical protein
MHKKRMFSMNRGLPDHLQVQMEIISSEQKIIPIPSIKEKPAYRKQVEQAAHLQFLA